VYDWPEIDQYMIADILLGYNYYLV